MEIKFQSSSNARTLAEAQSAVTCRMANSNDPRPKALVFDIDGTVLYNNRVCDVKKRVEGAYRLYSWAKLQGVAVFFVTARPDFQNDNFNRVLTERDLSSLGFLEKERIMMRPVQDVALRNELASAATVSRFKRECRDEISRSHMILMSLGDSLSDLIELGIDSPYERMLQKPTISCTRSYLLYLPGNNPVLNVKLKNEYLSDLADIAIGEKAGYASNKAALENGFELIKRLHAKRQRGSGGTRGAAKPFALVFDIDATVIYNYLKKNKDASGSNKSPEVKEMQRRVPESYAIIKWALETDVAVFFVTARIDTASNRQFAVDDLAKSGYTQYNALFMWPGGRLGVPRFKADCRCAIAKVYSILMSFGDSEHDIIDRESNPHFNEALSQIRNDRAYVLRLPHNEAKYNVKLHLEK